MAKIVFIGSGNLATNLAPELVAIGHEVVQVYSRTFENAEKLAVKVGAEAVSDPKKVSDLVDWYIIALSDKAIDEVLSRITIHPSALLVHTAGSQPIDILAPYAERRGVFYPLQTFSKSRKVDFSRIPFCIEAAAEQDAKFLFEEAAKISSSVQYINSVQRRHLHLAAVFACNFVNHFYALAELICKANNVSFDLIRPLIEETAVKAMKFSPMQVQTGPAVRFDRNIIDKHLGMLENSPVMHELYFKVSESIYKLYQDKQ